MSKRQDALRKMDVFNMHYVLSRFGERGVDDVGIDYRPRESRGVVSGSYALSPNHATAPNAAWYDHGKKTFYGNRSESMPKAMAWASERYGIAGWKPGPFGGKIPATVHARMMQAIKETAR